MEPLRIALIRTFAGIAVLAATLITVLSLVRFTPQAFLAGVLTGMVSGLLLCFLISVNWSPTELKPTQSKEGWETLGIFVVFIVGGFLVPYTLERLLAPHGGGVNVVSFGSMLTMLFTYVSIQIWRYRPRS